MAKQILPNYIGEGLASLSSSLGDISRNKIAQQQNDLAQKKYTDESAPYELTDQWIASQPASLQPQLRAMSDAKKQSQQGNQLVDSKKPDSSSNDGISALLSATNPAQQAQAQSGISDLLKGAQPGQTPQFGVQPQDQSQQPGRSLADVVQQQPQDAQQGVTSTPTPATMSRRDYLDMVESQKLQAQQEATRAKEKETEAYHQGTLALGGRNADIKQQNADTNETRFDPVYGTVQNRMDNAAHQNTIKAIKKDPALIKQLTQNNNISNAMSQIANPPDGIISPQQYYEAQQAVRSNLGIKGDSAIGERERTLMTSMGLNARNVIQFLTGNPQDIGKDNKFLKHIQGLADQESKNISQNSMKRINALSAGNKSMYARRPELKADIDDLIGATQAQFNTPAVSPSTAAPAPSAPEGYVTVYKGGQAVGHIPKGNLDKAKAQGYSEAP